MKVFGSTVVLFCLATSAQADYDDYDDDCRDEYRVVHRERGRTIIVEEPAPRIVIVEAPPPPPRRIVLRPEPPFVGAIWVEGYWRHTGVRFVWVRGHWIPPRYGYRFVPPRWDARRGHYYHTPGHFRPHHAKVKRRAYRHHRPRSRYVGHVGYERPVYGAHHRQGRRGHVRSPERAHQGRQSVPVRHVRDERRGHHRSRIHTRPHNARDNGRVRAPVTRPRSRPSLQRQRPVRAREAKRDRGRQIAAVHRGR